MSPDGVFAASVAVSFVLSVQAAGAAIFIWLWGPLLDRTRNRIVAHCARLAVLAILGAACSYSLEAVRFAGEWSGWTDVAMQKLAWQSPGTVAVGGRVVGLGVVLFGLCGVRGLHNVLGREGRAKRMIIGLGALVVVGSFLLTGHAAVSPNRLIASVLLYVHVWVVAFWFGALWPLQRLSRDELPAVAADVVARFSAAATWLVPTILLAGVGLALTLIPSVHVLTEPYGQLLITKSFLYAVLLGLASLNKWRLAPAIGRGDAVAFRRSVVAEYALICLAVVATAMLTTFYSPQ